MLFANPKHELFAQALAGGLAIDEAYTLAGLVGRPFGNNAGCYVYLLIDPRNGRVFYVGKGTGSRALTHGWAAHNDRACNALKRETIRAIDSLGLSVRIDVIEDGLSGREAIRLERMLIVRAHQRLTNISLGGRDPLDRLHEEARQSLCTIKPLCVMRREGAGAERMAVWVRVTSALVRISNRTAPRLKIAKNSNELFLAQG